MNIRLVFFSLLLIGSLPFAFALDAKAHSEITVKDGHADEDGNKWITSDVLYSLVFEEELETIAQVLLDYEQYPKIFSRLIATEILTCDKDSAKIRQKYEVRAVGFRFPSECVLQLTIGTEEKPKVWKQSWTMVSSDGSVKDLQGYWLLEGLEGAEGNSQTIVSYRSLGSVLKRFPLQESVMRILSEHEYEKTFHALQQECTRRSTQKKQNGGDAKVSQNH